MEEVGVSGGSFDGSLPRSLRRPWTRVAGITGVGGQSHRSRVECLEALDMNGNDRDNAPSE